MSCWLKFWDCLSSLWFELLIEIFICNLWNYLFICFILNWCLKFLSKFFVFTRVVHICCVQFLFTIFDYSRYLHQYFQLLFTILFATKTSAATFRWIAESELGIAQPQLVWIILWTKLLDAIVSQEIPSIQVILTHSQSWNYPLFQPILTFQPIQTIEPIQPNQQS